MPGQFHTAILVAVTGTVFLAPDVTHSQNPEAACRALGPFSFRIENDIPVEVQKAQVIAADAAVPAFCTVTGFVAPQVGFELRLPLENWNGRFLQQGCSGMCGAIKLEPANDALARGYAVATTDMGHRAASSRSGIWAFDDPSARQDFWYRGTHVTAVAVKKLVAQYYGRPASRSIHRGCGTGGRAGLLEAQRFPNDFDGILVDGAAVLNFVRNNYSIVWNIRANLDANGDPILSQGDLQLVHDAVLAQCADKGTGVVANPLACQFDPVALACPTTAAAKPSPCLTTKQVAAVRKYYQGPRSTSGEQIFAGLARGSELAWSRSFFGQPSVMEAFMIEHYRYLLFAEPAGPKFTFDQIDLGRPLEDFAQANTLSAADSIDYEAFKARKGRILMTYGWNTASMPAPHATAYYDALAQANGGMRATQEFFRLFMVPGNYVCVGGSPRGQTIDLLSVMEDWLEAGSPPARMVATGKPADVDQAATTRPLFPYPSHAAYRGRGDPGKAESYVETRPR
jgi:feruloyl esterase